MLIQERTYSPDTNSYRFGFNGYENESEILNKSSSIDFGMRIFNSGICRFFSVDPIIYHHWSPYQYDGNCPIIIKDYMGAGIDPPKEKGTKEGERKVVSETRVINIPDEISFMREPMIITESKSYYWHSGDENQIGEGWYSETDYLKLIQNQVGIVFDEEKQTWVVSIPEKLDNLSDAMLSKIIVNQVSRAEVWENENGQLIRNPAWDGVGAEYYELPLDLVMIATGLEGVMLIGKGIMRTSGKVFTAKLSRLAIKEVTAVASKTIVKKSTRIRATTLKEYKSLVRQISQHGSELTVEELREFEALTKQFGGKIRYDLNPVKGKNLKPHIQVEGLGSRVHARHIWLKDGVK